MSSNAPTIQEARSPGNQHTRETVEAIVVAFILAFLFRAFVAEAFVIPTGSMAPTLMGAHKDLTCQYCGSSYQVGASLEFDSETGARTGNYVIGSTSSICRAINPIDFRDANQATFSGDRILVSKFDYVLSKPERWDVLVFKFPEEARMNYIKRLVGLPGEQLMIREGDVYVRKHSDEPWGIARKPPHKILAMRQPVADTRHWPSVLDAYGYPSLWQPWSAHGTSAGWQVKQTNDNWQAELNASNDVQWLRYYHRELSPQQWLAIHDQQPLPEVSPTDSQLITDYLAYNSYYAAHLRQADKPQVEVNFLAHQAQAENGMHWVGDLMAEFEIEVQSDSGQLLLKLVEFGLEYQVAVDVANGHVTLTAWDASQPERHQLEEFFQGETDPVAACRIKGKGKYRVAMANVDDQIVFWVNGREVKFNVSAEFDSWQPRPESRRRPHWLPDNPLDAAPVAIGGQAISLKVQRAQVFRDLYYTAVQRQGFRSFDATDFGKARGRLRDLELPNQRVNGLSDAEIVRAVYADPPGWEKTELFSLRNHNVYELGEGQYFPLGDNSAQSSDARMWQQNFVDERFLLGKALLVFWPHYWNRPIPFLPNFSRMGLIR